MICEASQVPVETFERETGWILTAEGACRGGVCVALPAEGPTVDLAVVAERLGMGLVHDRRHGLWAVGPATLSGRALESAEAPDFVLPDVDGRLFRLSGLRGRKVVVVAWASW